MKKIDLLIAPAKEIVTLAGPDRPRRGPVEMNELGIIQNGAVAINDGRILETGPAKELLGKYQAGSTIDARGQTVTPGLIDPHTHPVFMGDRADEFELKLKGASYQEISARGGGIKSTVQKVRAADKAALKTNARQYLRNFIRSGTTTIDAKSGYGLTVDDEIKLLEVIHDLNAEQPLELVPTFLGAHDIPSEYKNNPAGYVKLVKEKMIPAVARKKLAEFCDIFCEKGVFEIDESRDILQAAKEHGFKLKLHADEFAPLGGAQLAAELDAVSADHLMAVSDQGIQSMKKKGVMPVILPGTTLTLGLKDYAPGRRIIDTGLPLALATDFNPGTSLTESMPLIMTLACVMMKLTPAEALTASTINAAYAIDRGRKIGRLQPGYQADLVIWQAPSYNHLPYHFGVNLADTVIKKGKLVITGSCK